MSDWQPIETAPKDGREVLLYWPRYAYTIGDKSRVVISIGYYGGNARIDSAKLEQPDDPFVARMSPEYWKDTWEYDDYALALPEHAPTHWMPLPDPPHQPTPAGLPV